MSTIDHGETTGKIQTKNKFLNRKFTNFDKVATVFSGIVLVGVLLYDQFTSPSQDDFKRVDSLKAQLSSQESKDAFDEKVRIILKDRKLTAKESSELALFSDKLVEQERYESLTLSINPSQNENGTQQ